MTPDRLLDHFDRISDAPDAIPRLRRFILDFAVRGKVVEQELSDEPVSELLKRMGAAKSEIVPFQIPSCWQWVRVGEIAECRLGKMLDKAKNKGTPRRYLRNVNVRWFDFDLSDVFEMPFEDTELDEFSIRSGDVLICEGGEPGRAAVWDEREADIYFQKAIHRVRFPKGFNPHYFVSVLRVSAESGRLAAYFTGVGIKHFTGKGLSSFVIPLPPLAEQYRIVAKVDELMALCDGLEAAQTERENRRDKLAAASLHRLNNGADADEFREHARFHLRHLPRLTTRPEHIQQLRQTILTLAVRGKLVPQDPNDEPATELLTQIQQKKNRLVQEGKIGKEKLLPKIRESDLPFALPDTWTWVRLGMICQLVTSGSRDWAKFYSVKGAIFLRMGNLSRGSYRLRLDNVQRVTAPADSEGARTKLQEGDILISITGDVGMLGLIPFNFGDAYINQHTCVVRLMDQLKNRYLPELFRSPFAQSQFNEPQRGIKNSFRLTDVTQFLVPLPPLLEQHRIVAKVDELMTLCDRLEAQLTNTQTESRRLLEAVLHEALSRSLQVTQ